eukprot:8986261-Pyramimonas_sp.AAC.1
MIEALARLRCDVAIHERKLLPERDRARRAEMHIALRAQQDVATFEHRADVAERQVIGEGGFDHLCQVGRGALLLLVRSRGEVPVSLLRLALGVALVIAAETSLVPLELGRAPARVD